MNDKERQLVNEMCNGDPERSRVAFVTFLNEEAPYLLRLIRKFLGAHNITFNGEEMAEEILQEVGASLVHAARERSLLGVRSLRAYVYNVARICTLDHLRHGARRSAIPVASETAWERAGKIMAAEGLNPVETRELEEALAGCIAQLEGKQREYIKLLALHCEDPLTPAGLAQLVGASPESVRQRLFEARQNLENCLRAKGFTIPGSRPG